ncbi:DUF4272 domain-containing protein [Massilia sp. CF038]|uniref:DUF4272 domain-containing protein n=1 Tax=Massilia sp. CF038 TaxID=1881045 RepID=UPI0009140726|nr:DUF4272 domain-containing protein [Massilia sp. CF038]SHH22404.1 protein of unknown function [Massilia sp. CF038]
MIERLKNLFRRAPDDIAATKATDDMILVNAYSTLLALPKPEFGHVLNNRRDLSDPELLTHLDGFCGYVLSRGTPEMSSHKYHAILHLQRVQQHASLWVAPGEMPALYAWARKANALLFLPDGHVLDPDGLVLVHAGDGSSAAGASEPYPEQALARKARIEGKLAAAGVETGASLPPLVCEKELVLRSEEEIAGRIKALLVCALRAESCLAGQPMSVDELFSKILGADDHLSAAEQAYLELDAPTQHQSVQLLWRYEAVYLLLWSLGLAPELPYPPQPCDAGECVRLLGELSKGKLRDPGEILDALDLHYRLHWSIRERRRKAQPEIEGIDAGVVSERHHALNWLVRFQHAQWDDVDTPT